MTMFVVWQLVCPCLSSSRLPCALVSRVWEAAAAAGLGAQGAEIDAGPQPWPRLGLPVVTHRVAMWL